MYVFPYRDLAPFLRTGDLLLYNVPATQVVLPPPSSSTTTSTLRSRIAARLEVLADRMCEWMHSTSATIGMSDNRWNSVSLLVAIKDQKTSQATPLVVSYAVCENDEHASFCFLSPAEHLRSLGVSKFAIRPLTASIPVALQSIDASVGSLNEMIASPQGSSVSDAVSLVRELLWHTKIANIDIVGHAVDEIDSAMQNTVGNLFGTGGVIDESMMPGFAYAPEMFVALDNDETDAQHKWPNNESRSD